MSDVMIERAIEMAKQFLAELEEGYEEPITASVSESGVVTVVFRPKGYSNPGWVIDPDRIEVLVNSCSGEVSLVPAM
jgi:hypothetical protein